MQPNYLISQSPDKVVLRNFEGVISSYPEPENYVPGRADDYFADIYPEVMKEKEQIGIAAIFEDQSMSYTPEGLARLKRRESYSDRPDHETLKSRRAKRDELKEKKFLAQQKKESETEGQTQ
ncbi:hypothetical protein [Bacillus swezeyi]|nr:hypothetical protein [Bacillus swezeyi]